MMHQMEDLSSQREHHLHMSLCTSTLVKQSSLIEGKHSVIMTAWALLWMHLFGLHMNPKFGVHINLKHSFSCLVLFALHH